MKYPIKHANPPKTRKLNIGRTEVTYAPESIMPI